MPESAFKFLRGKAEIKFLTLAIACGLSSQPVQAQFPYWYLYAGQSLLYPLTRTLGSGLFYGPYNSNPFYSTSSFLRRTAGRASQFPYVYPYGGNNFGPYGYRNAGLPASQNGSQTGSQNGDGMVDPNTGRTLDPDDQLQTGGQASSGAGSASPNFYLPGPQTQYQTLNGGPDSPALPGQVPPNYPAPNQSQGQQMLPAAQQIMPPKAPGHKRNSNRHGHGQSASGSDSTTTGPAPVNTASNAASPPLISPPPAVQGLTSSSSSSSSSKGMSASASGGSPLADGFVNHLVTKYDGHMGNALNNPDTRNWAKAMGLIEADHNVDNLPPDRIEVMGKILKDSSLDSVSKVDAVRILLKQKSPR